MQTRLSLFLANAATFFLLLLQSGSVSFLEPTCAASGKKNRYISRKKSHGIMATETTNHTTNIHKSYQIIANHHIMPFTCPLKSHSYCARCKNSTIPLRIPWVRRRSRRSSESLELLSDFSRRFCISSSFFSRSCLISRMRASTVDERPRMTTERKIHRPYCRFASEVALSASWPS